MTTPRKNWFDNVDPEQAQQEATQMDEEFKHVGAEGSEEWEPEVHQAMADNPDLSRELIEQAFIAKAEIDAGRA